jgi:hypothetical protein
VALSQARILYQNHSGDYPQVILTIPVTCRTTPIPKFRLYRSFLFGWWSNFVGSESGQKQSVKLLQNMVHNTIQPPPPPPPHSHRLSEYTVHLVRRGGCQREGGEVREKVEGQQYTSIVPSSMGATVHKLGRKYHPWVNVSPVYKIC